MEGSTGAFISFVFHSRRCLFSQPKLDFFKFFFQFFIFKLFFSRQLLMREGDKWKLFIPSELAYGKTGSGRLIKSGNTLDILNL